MLHCLQGGNKMAIIIKNVSIETQWRTDIFLCQGNDEFYINVRQGENIKTVIDNIKNLQEAKDQFLGLIWELS